MKIKIHAVKPTNNHGMGVVYGHLISSNKSDDFAAVYNQTDTFCKVAGNQVLLITDFDFVQPDDIFAIDSKKLNYKVYRDNKLNLENKLTFTPDASLFSDIENQRLFDFDTYKKFNRK
ncbi:hypothetical protein D0C36_04355 [Mucilaginibacter conchicola]|uniref:Uncharacterized protein n=1 Tax=Mucilaginibacter conchicola TaxID=2303333 RepID=A0A372NXD8_9SPHI|nr:hypothetical protein [Mucilaginibacter conchicola]RFZ94775.1 hypothetical protein D0C36_04355 [Mucilaginibacter conchicola]